ncbi:serine--tRNA ligase [bacterium]|jgi:seryl-tRNA synthetase|nr:serine--tRNA ligase [bacterium]MBT6832002.1 serine--tRNA ligase [bacterium]MBT6996712.1 serine--tRNA ligase [bacterium]MBT7772680.1 serine--tRNA ligase [bacterium]
MLDLKQIRKTPEEFSKMLARKGVPHSAIPELLKSDERRRSLQLRFDDLRAQQNEVSKKIPTLSGDEKNTALAEMKKVSAQKKELEQQQSEAETTVSSILEKLPNPPHAAAPDGKSDEENVVIRTEGKIPEFDFEPKDHADLAEILDLLDTERSAKVSGSRFYYLKNELAILQRALIFWAFSEVTKKGFTPMIPPFLTRENAIYGTGYLAHDENYVVNPGVDDLFLIGTSEVPMVSYHSDEILDLEKPKMYVSYSPCFRREAGTYGKDTRGIFRVHQFEKVEMVIFCKPDETEKLHEQIREVEEDLLKKLGLPYQVVNVCCGDLGISATKKYDLEAWLPGQNKYREMTSTSICTDFQSRRLNIRFRDENGKLEFAHILNGTAVSSRPLIGILENFQQADGSVLVPEVLRDLCGFDRIDPKK